MMRALVLNLCFLALKLSVFALKDEVNHDIKHLNPFANPIAAVIYTESLAQASLEGNKIREKRSPNPDPGKKPKPSNKKKGLVYNPSFDNPNAALFYTETSLEGNKNREKRSPNPDPDKKPKPSNKKKGLVYNPFFDNPTAALFYTEASLEETKNREERSPNPDPPHKPKPGNGKKGLVYNPSSANYMNSMFPDISGVRMEGGIQDGINTRKRRSPQMPMGGNMMTGSMPGGMPGNFMSKMSGGKSKNKGRKRRDDNNNNNNEDDDHPWEPKDED